MSAVAACEKATDGAPPVAATTAAPAVDPDGPAAALASEAEARATYDRAVLAHRAGQWAAAGELARSVGAYGGALGVDGYVVAARAAERAGNPARAARMWARAHAAACAAPSSCTVEPPRDDLFARAARYGKYVPWYGRDRCARAVRATSTIVDGSLQITPARAPAGGYEVREVPSRVLLERIDAPAGADLLCWSQDGHRRVAVVPATAHQKRTVLFGASGAGWTSLALPDDVLPEMVGYVGADGRALFPTINRTPDREMITFVLADPKTSAIRKLAWTPPPSSPNASLGAGGEVYAGFAAPSPKREMVMGLSRYDVVKDKGVVLFEDTSDADVGPVDEQGRVLVLSGRKLRWIEGSTGKVLAEMTSPIPTTHDGFGWLGVVPPSTVVWTKANVVRTADVATGTVAIGGIVWHPREGDAPPDLAAVTRALGDLPSGPSRKPWSAYPGWRVDRVDGARVRVSAAGRRDLSVVVAADRKGGFVVDGDGRFEIIGDVPAAFRASASCRDGGPDAPALPVEVCAAALGHEGLTAAWLEGR
ncbi:Hypothetical protein A7982_01382 [Minicystis rosea]|nr:Hypothetical protein A7982_01382 [Minicystis rosea]